VRFPEILTPTISHNCPKLTDGKPLTSTPQSGSFGHEGGEFFLATFAGFFFAIFAVKSS
jgi:hypothetical protein